MRGRISENLGKARRGGYKKVLFVGVLVEALVGAFAKRPYITLYKSG